MNILQKINLKLRLTFLFCLIFMGMLIGFCNVLYYQFTKLQSSEFDTNLYNYAIDVAESLDIDKYGDVEFDSHILKLNEKILPFTLKNSLISVLDVNGNILETRPFVKKTQVEPLDENSISKILKSGSIFSRNKFAETSYRVINFLLPILKKDTPLILQIAVPEKKIIKLNENLKEFFYISVPMMLFLSLLTGYSFTKKALAPMLEIIEKTKTIGIKNLKERVPFPHSKDEIWQLANTINLLLNRVDETFLAHERFIQDASHQMKTPLAIMKGELEIFKNEKKTNEEVKYFLQSMAQEIDFLTKLTNNLLILARVDSGVRSFSVIHNRIDEVVMLQVSRLSKLANAKKISLQIDFDNFNELPESALLVLADSDLLGILFYNLIENAIKYSNENSSVKIIGNTDGKNLKITVKDEGDGIPECDLEVIFGRFYRRNDYKKGTTGSGLGLAICKVVADSIDAKIWAEKNEKGTSFHFTKVMQPLDKNI